MPSYLRWLSAIKWFMLGFLLGRINKQNRELRFFSTIHFNLDFSQKKAAIKISKRKHAIIFPYRNRTHHLAIIKTELNRYLHRCFLNDTFSLWVIEQDNAELFNRGWLANVGIKLVSELEKETQCIIFHDVDLLPANESLVPYNECDRPIQLGSELEHWNWGVPYQNSAGGVVSMHLRHWERINGFSNDFEGWGGEDDDLFERIRWNNLLDNTTKTIRRPQKGRGIFHTISQAEEHHPVNKKGTVEYQKSLRTIKEMQKGSSRWKFDGLSDLTFTIHDYKNISIDGHGDIHHVKVVP